MKEYKVPLTLLQATIDYLQTKPHKEVFELVAAFNVVCKQQDQKEAPPVVAKPKYTHMQKSKKGAKGASAVMQ